MAQYRFAWPPVTKSVIAIGAVFFLTWFIPTVVEPVGKIRDGYLLLSASSVVDDYEVWTLLTYGVFHADFVSAFFSVFAIWLFGSEVQRVWGDKKYWLVQLAAVVLGGLLAFATAWLLEMQTPILGYHAAIMALLTAFCRQHWNRKLSLIVVELSGKTMLAFFLGLNLLMAALSGAYWMIALDVGGVVVGWFAMGGGGLNLRQLRTRFNKWRARRHLKVVRKTPDGEWVN